MTRSAWIAQQHGRKAVLYVVRVYSEGEAFYKIGITFDLSRRFSRLKTLYKWRTVARYSSWNAGKVWDLEQRLHREFLPFSYLPAHSFAGKTECYSECETILKALPASTFSRLKTHEAKALISELWAKILHRTGGGASGGPDLDFSFSSAA